MPKPLKDVDSEQVTRFLMGFAYGGGLGLFAGGALAYREGWPIFTTAFAFFVVCGLLVSGSMFVILGGVGSATSRLHNPSGSSTPHRPEYSRAQALAVRGQYEEAIAVYEEFVQAEPHVPEPYLHIARILRDDLKRYEEAVRWFKRARGEAHLGAGNKARVSREVAEIYMSRLGEPAKAAPALARLAEEFPESPEGKWAAAELLDVKRQIQGQLERD